MTVRRVAGAVLLATLVLAASACVPDDGLPPFEGNPNGRTVAVVGDSITNMIELALWLDLGKTYRSSINAAYGRVLDPLMDTGTGDPSWWTYARDNAAKYAARRPDYAVVSLGVNDGNRFTFNFPTRTNAEVDAHVARTEGFLESFMAIFPSSVRCLVLVTVVPSSLGAAPLQRWFQKWNGEVLPRMAAKYPRVRIADWATAVKGHESVWLRDTVHPSEAGAMPMSDVIYNALGTCPA